MNPSITQLQIGLRTLLAVVGGYAFTYAATAALARLLPLARFDAAMVASMFSFVIYLLFVLWAFATPSLWRVAAALAMALPLAALGFWGSL